MKEFSFSNNIAKNEQNCGCMLIVIYEETGIKPLSLRPNININGKVRPHRLSKYTYIRK